MLLQLKPNMPIVLTNLPTITEDRRMYFRDAYHHLYLNNKQKKEITHPQTIELEQENRIIVISDLTQVEKQSQKQLDAINATIWNVNPCSRALRNLFI
jgi:hypothetical protein